MSSIREKLEALEQLQKVDLEIRAARDVLEAVPARLKELDAARARAQAGVDAARAKLEENDRGRAQLERSVQEEREKIKKWEGRLGELKTSAQYSALAREIDISRKQNKTLEDEILRLMGESEELRKVLVLKEAELRKVEADNATERAALDARRTEAEAEVARLEARRAELSRAVDPGLLSRYENVRKRRAGVAVAPVVNGRCTACNMSIPPQLDTRLRGYVSVESCPHCFRIIYAAHEPPAEAAEQA